MKRFLLSLFAVLLIPVQGWGQASVLQGGSWQPGYLPTYSASGGTSQPVVQNSGPAAGTGVGVRELALIARGTGTAPYAGQGSGQLGTIFQIQDAPSSNASGYHALSFSANAQGGGLIAYNAYGGASALPLKLNVNGSTYEFPFILSGVGGPGSSTVGHLACWNNTSGTLLSDCTTIPSGTNIPSPIVTGGTFSAPAITGGTISGTSITATISGGTINNTPIGATTSQVGYFQPVYSMLNGYGNQGGGSAWQTQGHANWNVVQTSIAENPTEWQVYSNASMGIAQAQIGTDQLVRISGTPFSASWVGAVTFYYGGSGYKVATVTDGNNMTVQTVGGGAVSWGATANDTFYYFVTSTSSVCNTSGTAVTWVSGQPFIGFGASLTINGVAFTVASYNSATSLTLTGSAGTQTNAVCVQKLNIANALTTFRLQGLAGASEESFVITQQPSGAVIQTSYAGSGRYRRISVGTGESPVGTLDTMIQLVPNATLGVAGTLSLGGGFGAEAVRVPSLQNQVNYSLIGGNTTGLTPYISARGSDATVGLNIDVKGASTVTFTSNTFGNTEFQVLGGAGSSWLTVASNGSGSPVLASNGAAADINVRIAPKGAGLVVAGSPIRLQNYTVASLPACAAGTAYSFAAVSDATAPTYNAALVGGGAVRVPVFCDGTSWTSH